MPTGKGAGSLDLELQAVIGYSVWVMGTDLWKLQEQNMLFAKSTPQLLCVILIYISLTDNDSERVFYIFVSYLDFSFL